MPSAASAAREPSNKKSSSKIASAKEVDTHKLSLKGSSKLVTEFFEYSINTILFQRGVYPPEDFTAVKKYGLNMMVTLDDQVRAYIKKIMSQLSKWMQKSKISKFVIVITSKETCENLEKWQFDVNVFNDDSSKSKTRSSSGDKENAAPAGSSQPEKEKAEAEIQMEIQALFRQITASVSFLPILDGNCTFNVQVYADADSEVPLEWGDSDAKEVKNPEKVQLRSFSTNSHRVGTMVEYRLAD